MGINILDLRVFGNLREIRRNWKWYTEGEIYGLEIGVLRGWVFLDRGYLIVAEVEEIVRMESAGNELE